MFNFDEVRIKKVHSWLPLRLDFLNMGIMRIEIGGIHGAVKFSGATYGNEGTT